MKNIKKRELKEQVIYWFVVMTFGLFLILIDRILIGGFLLLYPLLPVYKILRISEIL